MFGASNRIVCVWSIFVISGLSKRSSDCLTDIEVLVVRCRHCKIATCDLTK